MRAIGLRIDEAQKGAEIEEGIPQILTGLDYTIRIFGVGFTENTLVIFTRIQGHYGGSCQIPATGVFPVSFSFKFQLNVL